MSAAQVEALGAQLTKVDDPSIGAAATVRSLPVSLTDAKEVSLFFGFDDRLWRVFITSSQWEDDKYGTRAMGRFRELSALLVEKYGKGTSYDRRPDNQFEQDPEDFASSLSSKDRIVATAWDDGLLSIELQLGADLFSTYYTLSYESDALAAAARKAIKDREKGAL